MKLHARLYYEIVLLFPVILHGSRAVERNQSRDCRAPHPSCDHVFGPDKIARTTRVDRRTHKDVVYNLDEERVLASSIQNLQWGGVGVAPVVLSSISITHLPKCDKRLSTLRLVQPA